MRARHVYTLVSVFGLAAGACARPPVAPPPPPPISRANVEQALQETVDALQNRDASKAGAEYTSDATFINARGKFDTQLGITRFWSDMLKTPVGQNLKLDIVKWGTSGEMAYSVSRFTGGITAPSGYVLAVSQRQKDGSLKVVAQVSVPDPAPAK